MKRLRGFKTNQNFCPEGLSGKPTVGGCFGYEKREQQLPNYLGVRLREPQPVINVDPLHGAPFGCDIHEAYFYQRSELVHHINLISTT